MYAIGIDVGATFIKMGLVDTNGRLKERFILPTPSNISPNRLIDITSEGIKKILKDSGISKRGIKGIGIGVPGSVDSKRGIVHYLPNIKGWKEVPLQALMKEKFHKKVALDNDVNAMTLAEYLFGAGRNARNIICLTLGTGVGGGIIIEGKLYRGGAFAAGEIGHMPINEDGPLCNCGGRACLERYIGNRYILKYAKSILKEDVTLERLSQLASSGNKKALKIWQDVGRRLGVALTQVINLLNPEKVIIGGGLSKAGKFILEPVRMEVSRRAMRVQARYVKIVPADLGDDAGIIGASLLIDHENL